MNLSILAGFIDSGAGNWVDTSDGIVKFNEQRPEYKEFVKIVHTLKEPKGNIETLSPAGTACIMIPKKSQNKEAMIKYINWEFKNLDNNMVTWYGIKDKGWKWVDEANHVYERLNTDYGSDFVTGARPMSEWDTYMDELQKAGGDQWSEAVIKQYNEMKK
nr:hypothetical protein [uncultured Niameybacter sp.]